MAVTDAELVQGFLVGEPRATRQIDQWLDEVLRHPSLGLGSDASDLAQHVRRKLLISWRAGRFQQASSLRTYVWRAAQHAAIDHRRARRIAPPMASIEVVAETADPSPSSESALLRRERRTVFAQVLARLGDDCRRLFELIAFDELSYREIAERLGTTEGAIKVRAHRCRERASQEYKSVTSPGPGRPSPENSR